MDERRSSNFYRVFWLSNFGNLTKVPIDQFVYGLGFLSYLSNYRSQYDMIKEFVEKVLIGKLLCPNFEVDLSTNEGAKILKISVNCISNQNIDSDIEDEPKQDRKIG